MKTRDLSDLFSLAERTALVTGGGSGLGLAVAEGIVREHAGTIIARNRKDARGAVFEIVLPREAAGGRAAGVPGEASREGDG